MSNPELQRLRDQLAQLEEREKASATSGPMRPVISRDAADRPITRYQGDPGACWNQFNPPVRHVRRFVTPQNR